MKRILAISGSRADYGLLEWPVKVLRESFEVDFVRLESINPSEAYSKSQMFLTSKGKPDCLLILGDRWEILQAAIAAHLQRVPIAHIGGGDVTLGSYDDAMRDCISRLATWHFCTSETSNLSLLRYANVYMVGNPAIDYIRHGEWKKERPFTEPYVVVSYQPETIDGTIEWEKVLSAVNGRRAIWMYPNEDAGSEVVRQLIDASVNQQDLRCAFAPHGEFLNILHHCEEFIGNSSAMLHEAPELGVKCRMIGKRQQGRVVPTGDGKASERIREVLCRVLS